MCGISRRATARKSESDGHSTLPGTATPDDWRPWRSAVGPAQGPEVIGLVLVDRGLLPQPLEGWIRVGVDGLVVRVVVDVALRRRGHGPPRCSPADVAGYWPARRGGSTTPGRDPRLENVMGL